MASKLYGVNATIILFVFVLYCIRTNVIQTLVEAGHKGFLEVFDAVFFELEVTKMSGCYC